MDILTDSHRVTRLEVVDTGRRRRWTPEEKLRIVEESLSAPRQASSTARRHGISNALLFAWRKAYREGKLTAEEEAPKFVPAVVAPDPLYENTALGSEAPPTDPVAGKASNGRMVIVLPGGRRVIVGRDVNAAALRRVLDVLERR